MTAQDDDNTKSGNEYMFNHDYKASFRLNYNHWLLKDIMHGHLLNPAIDIPTNQKFNVADVGAGTGIWVNEVAAAYKPNAHVTGFDISSAQFPPQTSRADNVDFFVQDAFKPFPPEHIGKYDIVNVKFLLCIIKNPDAGPFMKNVSTLLKPGGYLQWLEPLPKSAAVVKPDASMPSPLMDALVKQWAKPAPNMTNDWVLEIPDVFASLDPPLHRVAVDEFPMPKHYRIAQMYANLAGIDEVAVNQTKQGKAAFKGMEGWVQSLQEEMSKGMAVEVTHQQVVVKKDG